MRTLLLAACLLAFAAPASWAGGLNFSWSPAGVCVHPLVTNRTFACNTNSASFIAVGSVTPYGAFSKFGGLEAIISCQSDGPLPAWWQSFNSGSCRESSAKGRTSSVADGGCESLWPETPMGGIGSWQTALYPPPVGNVPPANRLVIMLAFWMATARLDLGGSDEYNAFQLVLDTNHTVADPAHGIAACAGCQTGVTLVLDQITLVNADGGGETVINELVSKCITWQSSAAECWDATPVRNTTWGAIKSFYR